MKHVFSHYTDNKFNVESRQKIDSQDKHSGGFITLLCTMQQSQWSSAYKLMQAECATGDFPAVIKRRTSGQNALW